MLAECISLLEVRRALEAGWLPGDIVLNGPGKWWPSTERTVDGLRVIFSDSVEELERLVASGRGDRLWGVRLRIPGSRSRFGVPVDEPADFERLGAAVSALPAPHDFGVHVHMASTMIGVGHWRDITESAIAWARALEAAAVAASAPSTWAVATTPTTSRACPSRRSCARRGGSSATLPRCTWSRGAP